MRERAIMIEIRAIQEKDYPEVARIWRDVLDIPEDYRSVYYWKGGTWSSTESPETATSAPPSF